MMCRSLILATVFAFTAAGPVGAQTVPAHEPAVAVAVAPDPEHEARMAWWREARFGLFIHWGLYAIPAGEWPGRGDHHGEWIRDTARIPRDEYARLAERFNPTAFDADAWVALARDAGMRYLVITSKHHDGFALFDSAHTEFDVMRTPFNRDIMLELAEACRKTASDGKGPGVRFCMYHSIMDWHHPDYLPRRPWERADRPTEGADFERFVAFLNGQLGELMAPAYDPGVLWFDGEWEGTWTHERGKDLHAFIRAANPRVIVNNRIDKGRAGMEGHTKGPGFLGDYHTPEQTIPDRGLPGDWETCMTMNGHWGYNAKDLNYKSTPELIRMLCDIASKGGNFLLNVGPTAEGRFPEESIARLREIGVWMRTNGDAIYGTERSPLSDTPAWGRVTMRKGDGSTQLFLHLFEIPSDGRVLVPGLLNPPEGARLLLPPETSRAAMLPVSRSDEGVVVDLSDLSAYARDSLSPVPVITLWINGEPDVVIPPTIDAPTEIFVGSHEVTITNHVRGAEVRFTADGRDPTASSLLYRQPLRITRTMTIAARAFRGGEPVGPIVRRTFTNAPPRASVILDDPGQSKPLPGLRFEAFKGEWDTLPDFASLTPAGTGIAEIPSISHAPSDDAYALRFIGYLVVPANAAYSFHLASDDGSRLYIGSTLVVDHDGLHSLSEKSGVIALGAGYHPITVEMFEKSGGADLALSWSAPGVPKQVIPASAYVHVPK
ncbi:MAG: alpha-L-fucosidase [Phycisphaeraceae bacterium]|nr:MAG: alpha-L-fucosidase [Phycisphaeraceae bacterium]